MGKRLALTTLSVMFFLCCCEVSWAEDVTTQDEADTQIAGEIQLPLGFTRYEPTGDALWDTYAQAVLEQIAWQVLDYMNQPVSIYNAVLPQETILEWEDEFGDDPRYWQLCYINADSLTPNSLGTVARIKGYSYTGPAPIKYLEQALELDVMNIASFFLLAHARYEESEHQEGAYSEEQIIDWLIEQCPDESMAYYRSAQYWFKINEWERGLADLEAGNVAKNNQFHMTFPLSFLVEAANNQSPVGNDVVAGAVSRDIGKLYFHVDCIRVKWNLQSQFERLNQGHSTEELAPWVTFLCRFPSSESGAEVWGIAGTNYLRMIAKYLLVDGGDQLTRDQRGALLELSERAATILANIVYDSFYRANGYDGWEEKVEQLFEEYGFSMYGMSEDDIDNIDTNDPKIRELELATYQIIYEHDWVEWQRRLSIPYSKMVKDLENIMRFDPVAIEWQPR